MEDMTFYPFYEDRINRVIDKLKTEYEGKVIGEESIWNGIGIDIYEVFHNAAVRCLIAELHICKSEGRLFGSTASEEYDSYCMLLEDKQYIDTIYQKYPGLLLYLDELEKRELCFWKELLEHLFNDWMQLKAYFQLSDESRILFIKRSGSDFHCNGKSVVILEMSYNKRILYKPHSLGNEMFLQNLLIDIYRDLEIKEFEYLELDKTDYGWVEEIIWKECKNEDEVTAFYTRMGILAAVAYVLGIGDLHYENIIAHGEFPVIIDAETVFQSMEPLYQWIEKTTNFYSVLSSGLFPGGVADRNTAGISGGSRYVSTKRFPVVCHDKTSDICIGYQTMHMPEGKNHAKYHGNIVYWTDYLKEIKIGFQLAYDWFCSNQYNVLKNVFSWKGRLKSRYVSERTQFYALSIFASVHPELMQSENSRACYLYKLCKNNVLRKQEVEAMLRGDIPFFFKKLIDLDLYDGQNVVVQNFTELTIEEELKRRLLNLSADDCKLQVKVIEYTSRVFKNGNERENFGETRSITSKLGTSKVKIVANSIGYAKRIADYMLENAIVQQNKIYWMEMEEENGTTKIRPIDLYFYSGVAGIAVFFREMNKICGLYEDICEKLEKMLFSYTDCIYEEKMSPATDYVGMYCGEGSVVYAYQLLYKITGNKKYRDYADKHSAILMKCVDPDAPFDLLYGNAGAVLTLCRQYIDTGDEAYLSEANSVLEYLDNKRIELRQGITWYEKAEGNPVCSMAHGNSGVMLAYARIHTLDNTADYSDRIKQIIKYEDQFYDSVSGNWADLRKNREERWRTYAWCNGGVGLIAARMQADLWNDRSGEMVCDINKVMNVIDKLPIQSEMCLCHGNVGVYLILNKFEALFNNVLVESILREKREVLKKHICDYLDCFPNHTVEQYGLMNGIAGIGIGALLMENEPSFIN